jgi:hypothetical protein
MSKIDSTTALYCKAYGPIIAQKAPDGLPMRLFRQQVVANLAERLLGQQLAAEYGVQPSEQYASAVSSIRQQFASSSKSAIDAGVEVEAGDLYLKTVQVSIGRQLLAKSGQSNPSVDAALQRGQVATQDWLKDHDIKIDPSLNVTFDAQGNPSFDRDQTSYPLSPLASQGMAPATAAPDPSYVAGLPKSQVCQPASS